MKWLNSIHMTCIHRLGDSWLAYVISNIPLYNIMINIDILNDHELDLHSYFSQRIKDKNAKKGENEHNSSHGFANLKLLPNMDCR